MDHSPQDKEYNKILLNEIACFIDWLNSMNEEDALNSLRLSADNTLIWILKDIAIPGCEFYIACLVKEILQERGFNY